MKSCCCYCSVAKSYPTLRHHGLQHTRPPCPSPSPGACSNSSIESVMPSNHLSLCRPLLLLPSIFPSIRVFSNESTLHIRWPKYWSFSFSISPSSEYSELISWRRKWQPTPVPLPRKAWQGYSPWGCKESDMTERLHFHFPLELTGLISLLFRELSRVFFSTPQFKSINSLVLSLLYGPTLTFIEDSYSVQNYQRYGSIV